MNYLNLVQQNKEQFQLHINIFNNRIIKKNNYGMIVIKMINNYNQKKIKMFLKNQDYQIKSIKNNIKEN